VKGQQLWDELERRGREKYHLDDTFHLNTANVADPEIAQIELTRKGPRGGWLRGKDDRVRGQVVWTDINDRRQSS
jgi:hypothetical protein